MDFFEKPLWRKGRVIAGIDEAGRGPLAGPVVAAACILPPAFSLRGVDDSKKLTPKKREELFSKLTGNGDIYYALGVVDNKTIDAINILQATFRAMNIAVAQLKKRPDFLLIDGNLSPPTKIVHKAIIKGDGLSISIAAASIIAKVSRDRLMLEYHRKWPGYDFASHKGYGTKKHISAIKKLGLCEIHRKSFLRKLLS